jgi:hypothetical protein
MMRRALGSERLNAFFPTQTEGPDAVGKGSPASLQTLLTKPSTTVGACAVVNGSGPN